MSLNVSDVIVHVKNIVDSTRCTVCDKADGGRMRFVCGHTNCDDCLVGNEGCMLCLTPPNSSKSKLDETLSQRVRNACNLLNVCQDTFELDVYRRLRVSEQLKSEKELFPECIQAPAKYYNKRKSINTFSNKENSQISFHPGEHISHTDSFKMKKSNNYVQQWLEKSESSPRKALADLNVNNYNITSNKRFQQTSINSFEKQSKKSFINKDTLTRKRPHSLTSVSLISRENSLQQSKIKKRKISKNESFDKKVLKKADNGESANLHEESGIVLDDEPILIEDSQSQIADKDQLALLAVQAAEQEQTTCVSLSLECTQDIDLLPPVFINNKLCIEEKNTNVLFYKKASLANCCNYCKADNLINNADSDTDNVAITIENKHFITTINITKCAEVVTGKKSILIQTNFDDEEQAHENYKECGIINKTREMEEVIYPDREKRITDSLDIVRPQGTKHLHGDNNAKRGGITIDDSDSDESFLGLSFLEVTADVHKSCEPLDYGILSEISTNEPRARNKVRCVTPDSNNSSEKENCDPNKRKKQKTGKKNKLKKITTPV